MVKFVFVTGGVVSSLGKGIVTASLGAMLKSEGYKISLRKLDPYLNVDPGTISPIQHGEVFVTEDGGEVDLDLGHYERFTEIITKQSNNITSGKIYQKLLHQERRGVYLGATVQVVPHVTDLIKDFISTDADKYDFILCEIGGTVGDIESQPFLEAIRQLAKSDYKNNVFFIHTTLVPYIEAANEMKTKPTQHSVKELMRHGIEPHIVVCRVNQCLHQNDKRKISLLCNVEERCIIEAPDVKNIYEAPLIYHKNGLCEQLLRLCELPKIYGSNKLMMWETFVKKMNNASHKITVAIVGKYNASRDAYKSLVEALVHACANMDAKIEIKWVDAHSVTKKNCEEKLCNVDCIIVPGGFGNDGIDGKLHTIQYARENAVPFLGICLGMQLAVIEFARNILGLQNANSREFVALNTDDFEDVVTTMHTWQTDQGQTEYRTEADDLGGSMRLGSYKAILMPNTLAYRIYNTVSISERHRHRYEVNIKYHNILKNNGAVFSAFSPDMHLPEIMEIEQFSTEDGKKISHPFFLSCQFHPEFNSNPFKPHPIFKSFINAAMQKESSN